uniref:Uncharacterized protein n=1 Tax=Anguilla anguilla TaxID=7936 RepID=A0A0E9V3G6_ANGAN
MSSLTRLNTMCFSGLHSCETEFTDFILGNRIPEHIFKFRMLKQSIPSTR